MMKTLIRHSALRALFLLLWAAAFCVFANAQQPAKSAAAPAARQLGTIKSVNDSGFVLANESGNEFTVTLAPGARLVRTAPGQRDLKSASPIQLQELQPGDRALIRGEASPDGKSIVASSVIAMKQSDIAEKQQQDREDWQRRGVGGIVKSIDASTGAITLTAGAKTIQVHISKATAIRRYSPDSVRFDDAKPGTLDQIKPGDQLRARGDKNEDGTQIQAQEIVSGAFRNIAGTVIATDAAQNTVTVKDLATKKPVTVKVSNESQMHSLPEMVANRLAMRLKGAPASAAGNDQAAPAPANAPAMSEARPHSGADLQQILSRMPSVSIASLQKGQAVMMVTTEGSENVSPTVITLLTGVEPILSASPNDGRAAMMLSPWSLGGGGGGGEEAQ